MSDLIPRQKKMAASKKPANEDDDDWGDAGALLD